MHTLSAPRLFNADQRFCHFFSSPLTGELQTWPQQSTCCFHEDLLLESLTLTISVSLSHTYLKINSINIIPSKMLILIEPMNAFRMVIIGHVIQRKVEREDRKTEHLKNNKDRKTEHLL